jgi:fibronectin type 3 domain-containing protein
LIFVAKPVKNDWLTLSIERSSWVAGQDFCAASRTVYSPGRINMSGEMWSLWPRRNKPKARKPRRHPASAARSNEHGTRPLYCIDALEGRLLLSVNITTFHYDTQSTGANLDETILTPANVNTSSFGKLFSDTLDGQVYAEPLTVAGVSISGGPNTVAGASGVHDVVYVCTESDSIYAIDAHSGAILWYRQLTNVANTGGNINNTLGATAISDVPNSVLGVPDIAPTYGITGTPVIDTANNIMYVSAATAEVVKGQINYVQRLHAINLSNGTDVATPYMFGDTIIGVGNTTQIYAYGTGDGAIVDPYNGTGKDVVQFNAVTAGQRAGLSLVNGIVYVEWASHGDVGPYHGWIAALNVANLATNGMVLCGVLCTSPNDGESGIWGGGGGLAFEPDDSAFYFMTGNGTGGAPTIGANGFPTDSNYNEAVVKAEMDPTTSPTNQGPNGWGIKIVDWFIPYNVAALDAADSDFGSGSPTVLPASAGIPGHPNLLIAAGKSGVIYVLDRDDLGHYSSFSDAALNSVNNGAGQTTPPNAVFGVLSASAYFNGHIYTVSGYSGPMDAFVVNSNGILSESSQTTLSSFGYIPGSPVVSADGTTDGIVWVLDRNGNELHAYDANSLSTELWNSNEAAGGADLLGPSTKFAVPTVANGMVYVGTLDGLVAYGLKAPANAPPNAPVITSATALSNSTINLVWTDSTKSPNIATAYEIMLSTDDSTFTQVATAAAGATSIAVGGLSPGTNYYFQIVGVNPFGNSSPSAAIAASTTAQTAAISFPSGFTTGAAQLLQLNGNAAISNGNIILVNNTKNQDSSVWYNSQQDISQFSTTFTISITGTWPIADGLTFTIQRDLLTALGVGGQGLGYGAAQAGGVGGIPNSLAIKFDTYNTTDNGTTGLYTGGTFPGVNGTELGPLGINLRSYDQLQVSMTYDGVNLTVTITDLTTKKSATQKYQVNIPAIIGGSTAWVGFTGGDGALLSEQQIFNWTFASGTTGGGGGGGGGGGIVTSPNAPTGLGAVAATATSINLNWTPNGANQTGFYLDRATDPNFTQNLITQTLPATPNTFTDSYAGITPGGTYYYRIRAYNSAGPSGNSNSASVTIPIAPPTPTNAQTTFVSTNEIDLVWTDNAGHLAEGYEIYRSTNSGPTAIVANLPPTSRTAPDPYGWNDTSVQPGNSYNYHIVAYNSSGNNDFAGINVTTPTLAPAGVVATPGNASVSLTWNSVNGATGYNVYRASVSGGPYSPIANNISTTSYTDSPLTNGVAQYYVITALDADGESAQSAEVNATPGAASVTINDNGFAGALGSLALNGSARLIGSSIALINGVTSQVSSIYDTTLQTITDFSTTFAFLWTGSWPLGDGFTFVIQNAGLSAIGQSGGGLGYGPANPGAGGIANSVAVKFDVYSSTGEGTDSTGLYTDGQYPHGGAMEYDLTSSGFNLRSYDLSTCTLAYNGTVLTETLTDTVTKKTATETYVVNIPAIVGGNTAYVGFTGADGALTSIEDIESWTYTANPTLPSTPVTPAAPASFTATPGPDQAILNWAASSGAASYTVSYGTTSNGPYPMVVSNITGLTATINNLIPGTTYYFVVTATNSAGTSGDSTQASTVPTAPVVAPSAPTSLTATPGNGQVTLVWSASTGATGYIVNYGTTNGSQYTTVVPSVAGTTETIANLSNGTTYYFVVLAANSAGTSGNSPQASATPAAPVVIPLPPTGLTATAGNGQVVVSWTSSIGAASYTVSYGITNGSAYTTTAPSTSATTQIISNLLNGTTYYFVVTATDSAGTSGNSSQASATPITIPAAPTGLTAKAGNGQVVLTWTASLLATSYTVSYGTTNGSNYNMTLASTGATTLTVINLTNGTTYYFVVTAANSAGTSGNSSQASAAPAAPPAVAINYPNGFTGASGALTFNGNAKLAGGTLSLTNNSTSQNSSVYFSVPQNITNFTTTFLFLINGTWPLGDGFTFVIQNYALNALGVGGSGLGYGDANPGNAGGIPNSVAVKFDTFSNTGEGADSTGLYTDGAFPHGGNMEYDLTSTGFNMRSYDLSTAVLSYNGTVLTETLTDTVTNKTATESYTVNIPAIVGGSTAFIGFTAADGGLTSSQVITGWTYSVTPPVAPTGVSATTTAGQTTVSWNPVAGAASYNIKSSATSGGPYTTIASSILVSSDTVTLTPGATYYLVVTAVGPGGESLVSPQIVVTV